MEYYDGRLSVIVEWFDEEASLVKKYVLIFFEDDCTIEMFNQTKQTDKSQRLFLHRTRIEGICKEDLMLGNSLNILGRRVVIIDYADFRTRQVLHVHTERAILILYSIALDFIGEMMTFVMCHGFKVKRLQTFKLTSGQASQFHDELSSDPSYRDKFIEMATGPIVVFELTKQGALQELEKLMSGPTPLSHLAGKNAAGVPKPVFYTGKKHATTIKNLQFFFAPRNDKDCGDLKKRIANEIAGEKTMLHSGITYTSAACILIKPHALQKGVAGEIIEKLKSNGFKVTCCFKTHLDKVNAVEFYEVYRGVLPEYNQMVNELCSSPCLALEVKYKEGPEDGATKHDILRSFVGPLDPEMARDLRPHTLRAQYGFDRVHNGVHVTDLLEDTNIELEYFFKILQGL